MSESLYVGPAYGQFAASCEARCCATGLMDLYCSSVEPGRQSSGRYFTRSCSVNTRDYPDNGAVLDRAWGYAWSGADPVREILLSKAAWEHQRVFQLECTAASTPSAKGPGDVLAGAYRALAERPDAPLDLQIPSRETSLDLAANYADWYVHRGAFTVRASAENWGEAQIKRLTPLWGIVATADDSLASFDTQHANGILTANLRVGPDFRSAAFLFRMQDEQNCLRIAIRKGLASRLVLEAVVAGSVTELASQPLNDPRVFTPYNYHAQLNYPLAGAALCDTVTEKQLTVTLQGNTVKVRFLAQIRADGPVNENTDITFTVVTSQFATATRCGLWAEVAEVALGPITVTQATSRFTDHTRRAYLSVYDDSVPTQEAEFDVTDFFDKTSALSSYFGTLIAGGTRALWLRRAKDPAEPDLTRRNNMGRLRNDCSLAACLEKHTDGDAEYYTLNLAKELQYAGGWTATERAHYSTRTTYERVAGGATFQAHPFQLARQALPVFAQHAYPRCAGWRMADVTWSETSRDALGVTYQVTIQHEIIAGDVVWPADRSLPYVDDASPTVLHTRTEVRALYVAGFDAPTEDVVRFSVTPLVDINLPESSYFEGFPLEYFEADPQLEACILGWSDRYYAHWGNQLGLVQTGASTYPFNYRPAGWPDSPALQGSGAVAPGGKVAVAEVVWAPGAYDLDQDPTQFRLSLYQADGSAEQLHSPYADDQWPPRIAASGNNRQKRFHVLAASDRYVYVKGPAMSQPEADTFALHSLPVLYRRYPNAWFYGLSWLISWDGEVRVPLLGKLPYQPEYVSKELFAGSGLRHFLETTRQGQGYDCIKDSNLPHTPDFQLSPPGEVPFVHDFDDHYGYTASETVAAAGVHFLQLGLGARAWVAPVGTTQITVECWGGGGGGGSVQDPEIYP